ncbi:DUF2617 family protein [Kitasatospora sp. NBC_01250]|uniref:DUF2617 family protein n=1 Tax=unclassified Kitasatospora TaxID=2633591 RepID=UPI002E15166A|nr:MULTISPECIES: DUF2617 family protein [unclassified Kitasatospora]WSJ68260.1 DUF2617 family protein [Kitasatospora sp. NBC_01302]
MLTTLQTSYTDTRAGDLAWCLGGAPLPALAVRDLTLPGPDGLTDGTSRYGTAARGTLGSAATAIGSAGNGGSTRTTSAGGNAAGTLQLRLLGASHQVVITAGPGECLETVACMPGRRTPLPARVAEQVAGWEYEFAARIESLPPHVFAARAQEILALVDEHPRGLAGVFPGDPSAFTALVAQGSAERVLWRTWHAYPQEGRLVCTRSSLVVRGQLTATAPRAGGRCAMARPTVP